MTYTDFIYVLGDGILWTCDIVFENVGSLFNYAALFVGLFGAIYWLRHQAKYQKIDKENEAKGIKY